MSTVKIPREQTEILTPEGILSFTFLFPGQAQDSITPGSKAYKTELVLDPHHLAQDRQLIAAGQEPQSPMVKAVKLVAQTYDPGRWAFHVFGPGAVFSLLEEMDKRDATKYPYAAGKYILRFSQVWSLKMLNMEGANLTDPATRAKYDAAMESKAPGATRFANPANPSDIAKIEEVNKQRVLHGLVPHPEADYHKILLPVASHEIWAGCYGHVSGRCYWSSQRKAVHLALNHVLFTRQGERLVGESSPDAAFAAFAPPAELAPQPVAAAPVAALPQQDDPWANMVS